MYALYNSFIGNFPAKSEGICLGICLQNCKVQWGNCAFVQHLAFSEAMRCALLTAEAMPRGKLCCCCRKRSQLATRLTLSRTCARNRSDVCKQCHVATEDFPRAGFCGSGRFERNNWIGRWGWGRTPQVEVKQHKEESAKESQESGEDKEAKESWENGIIASRVGELWFQSETLMIEEKRKKQKRKKRQGCHTSALWTVHLHRANFCLSLRAWTIARKPWCNTT